MGLRNTLKKTVARCTPQGMQHATFSDNAATADATPVQQMPAIPHGIRANAATAIATAMQQGPKSSATTVQLPPATVARLTALEEKLQVSFTSTCNTQLGGLTRHRVEKELLVAAGNVCDLHGDNPEAREAMRRDCLDTPDHLKPDLLEHFRFVKPQSRQAPAPPPKKAPEPPADPQQWRELAQAYRNHHTGCKTCCAAGQGRGQRCGTGAALWVNYQSSI